MCMHVMLIYGFDVSVSILCLTLFTLNSLNRHAYCPKDRVTVQLEVENCSAVDVTGLTLKVIPYSL